MDNVPVRVDSSGYAGRNSGGRPSNPDQSRKPSKSKLKKLAVLVAGVVLLLVLLLGVFFVNKSSTAATIDDGKYQALFLTNGQVYFGKLDVLNGDYFKLSDIFYLQAQSEAGDNQENPQETSDEQSPDVQLIKLGEEIHGPVDEMLVSRDQVLFFENLKEDSQVSASIKEYYSQNQ